MKKVVAGIVVAALVATMGAGSVFAMGGHHGGWRNANTNTVSTTGYQYVDANGDGVCDWYGTQSGCGINGSQGCGYGYVDADGNGVCDNYGTGAGCGIGMGCGYGYVDANGDGVCDYYGTGVSGSHHGRCAR